MNVPLLFSVLSACTFVKKRISKIEQGKGDRWREEGVTILTGVIRVRQWYLVKDLKKVKRRNTWISEEWRFQHHIIWAYCYITGFIILEKLRHKGFKWLSQDHSTTQGRKGWNSDALTLKVRTFFRLFFLSGNLLQCLCSWLCYHSEPWIHSRNWAHIPTSKK